MPEFAYGSGLPQPVPPMKPERLADGVTLVRPLSRKGIGPGMIVLSPNTEAETPIEIQDGIPGLRMKWAEEGYCVVEIRPSASSAALRTAVAKLSECQECEPREKMGLICYDPDMWNQAAAAMENLRDRIVCAAVYADVSQYSELSAQATVPTIFHLTGKPETAFTRAAGSKIHKYGRDQRSAFAVPFHRDFHYATEAVSHTRNLQFMKSIMGGPHFDLELLWDEHTYYEFEARDVESTMATMVEEPYVNHIPTITGGIGRENLTAFYRDHFIFSNPRDAELELISRTVGVDRVVDEFIYKFTHDLMIDWLLPGVPPTYKYIEIPMMAVVNIRGDRLYHEHISWDQGTALKQIGCLPEVLPLTTMAETRANGVVNKTYDPVTGAERGKNYEIMLPVAAKETVAKMRDKNSVASNAMFEFKAKEI